MVSQVQMESGEGSEEKYGIGMVWFFFFKQKTAYEI